MTTLITTTFRRIRTLLIALMLVFASTLAASGSATAEVLRPNMDAGGPGGGGGSALIGDEVAADTTCGTVPAPCWTF